MISRAGWCSLQLASACISRDTDLLAEYAAHIITEFDARDIREIWQKAKATLQLSDIRWMKQQLMILASDAIAA